MCLQVARVPWAAQAVPHYPDGARPGSPSILVDAAGLVDHRGGQVRNWRFCLHGVFKILNADDGAVPANDEFVLMKFASLASSVLCCQLGGRAGQALSN